MSKFLISIFLSTSLLGMLNLFAPSLSWGSDISTSARNTLCDDSILDIDDSPLAHRTTSADTKLNERWEKARAVYERDLDFADIDTNKLPEDYSPLRDLVEAKYRIALAEGKLIVQNFDKQAISDLQQAQSFLTHALKNTNEKNTKKFENIKSKVDHILKFVSNDDGCWSTRLTEAFDNVNYDIEQVLQAS